MDLIRAWLAAAVAWLAGTLAVGFFAAALANPDALASFSGRLTLAYLPSFVVYACVAALAALIHPRPERERPARHALAVLGVPALGLAVVLGYGAARGTGSGDLFATVVVGVLGAIAGWLLADLPRRSGRRGRSAYWDLPTPGYPAGDSD
ncbi:MAG: hypothetical protein GEV03_01425 [Streptosporangiales bacterium]|nr:hypothetical protein [Streptosporangiales bacterium]